MDFTWSLIYCTLKSEYFKAAIFKCVKLERMRAGIERADILHSSCEMLLHCKLSLKAKAQCQPIDVWGAGACRVSCASVGVNVCPSVQEVTGISTLHEPCATRTWNSMNCACLHPPGSVLSGLSLWSSHRDSTIFLFLGLSSLSLPVFSYCWTKVFLAAHSAGYVLPFSQGAWETIVFFFTTKSLAVIHNRKWSNLSVPKYLFSFLYAPNKQTPDVELQKSSLTYS